MDLDARAECTIGFWDENLNVNLSESVTTSNLPEFEKPPVVEVVCGVQFKPLTGLLAAHLGNLWEKLQPDYSDCREVAPLAPAIERFEGPLSFHLQLEDVPPLPRTWFIHKDESGLIQVQRDRFLHNWKKVRPEHEYPRFHTVITLFRARLATFDAFLSEVGLESFTPQQYEITYVNNIPQGAGWKSLEDTGSIFPDFKRRGDARFLPEPEQINWRTSFVLPERQGRLHFVVRNSLLAADNSPMLQVELTARGMPHGQSRDDMWQWFEMAHEWIVQGFADLTAKQVRTDIWKQTR